MIGLTNIGDVATFDCSGGGNVTLTAEDWGDASAVFERLMPETTCSPVWSDLIRPGKRLPPGYESFPGTVELVPEFRAPFVANETRTMYFVGGDGSIASRYGGAYRLRVVLGPSHVAPELTLTIAATEWPVGPAPGAAS
jgi:hypothetical protein